MNRRLWILVLAGLALFGTQLSAQEWQLNSNQISFGVGVFSPSAAPKNVALDKATAFTVDYRYFFAKYWAVGVDYSYARMDASSKLPVQPFAEVNTTLPLNNFTGLFQFRFPTGSRVEPYLGAGVNLLLSQTDSSKNLWPIENGLYQRVTPMAAYNWGGMVQAGLDWRIKDYWVFNVDIRYVDSSLKMQRWQPYHGAWVHAGDYTLQVKPMTYSFSVGWRW
jgi:outer membrane protein W